MSDKPTVLPLAVVAEILGVHVGDLESALRFPGHPAVRWAEGERVEGIPTTAVAAWARFLNANRHSVETRS